MDVGEAFRLPRDGEPVPYDYKGRSVKFVILSEQSESKNLRTS